MNALSHRIGRLENANRTDGGILAVFWYGPHDDVAVKQAEAEAAATGKQVVVLRTFYEDRLNDAMPMHRHPFRSRSRDLAQEISRREH